MTKKQNIKEAATARSAIIMLGRIVTDIEYLQAQSYSIDREIKEALQHSKKSAMIALEKVAGPSR